MKLPSHPHTHNHDCSQEIYTTIPTESFCRNKTKQSYTNSRQNNLHSVCARPNRIYEQSGHKIHNNALPMQHTHPQHLSTRTHTLQIIKALTATGCGKPKETLMATYKAVMRPALEHSSSICSPLASSTSINKLQVMQNAALRTTTGCTQDTNIHHLHDETLTLLIHEHLQLHASQHKHKTQHPSHPLHKHTTYFNTPRLKTLFLTTDAAQQTFTQSLQQT